MDNNVIAQLRRALRDSPERHTLHDVLHGKARLDALACPDKKTRALTTRRVVVGKKAAVDPPSWHLAPAAPAPAGDAAPLPRRTYVYARPPFFSGSKGVSVGMYVLLDRRRAFFSDAGRLRRLVKCIGTSRSSGDGEQVHMRNFNWFCTNYGRGNPVDATYGLGGQHVVFPPALSTALHAGYLRDAFDAHCREDARTGRRGHISVLHEGTQYPTTVAQVNFVYWMMRSGIDVVLMAKQGEVAAHSRRCTAQRKTQRQAAKVAGTVVKRRTYATSADAGVLCVSAPGTQLVLHPTGNAVEGPARPPSPPRHGGTNKPASIWTALAKAPLAGKPLGMTTPRQPPPAPP
jgi:hypothetical protein